MDNKSIFAVMTISEIENISINVNKHNFWDLHFNRGPIVLIINLEWQLRNAKL